MHASNLCEVSIIKVLVANNRVSELGRALLLIGMLLGLSVDSTLASIYTLADDVPRVPISSGLWYLEDENSSLSVEEVRRPGNEWREYVERNFNEGFSLSTWWIKFEVENSSDRARWLIYFMRPFIDHVQVFLDDGETLITFDEILKSHSLMLRPVENRYVIQPIDLVPHSSYTFIIRYKSAGPTFLPIHLWQEVEFFKADAQRNMFIWFLWGVVLALVGLSACVLLLLGERKLLVYPLTLGAMSIAELSARGWTNQILWSDLPLWSAKSPYVFIAIYFGLQLLSFTLITELKSWSPRLQKLCYAVTFLLLVSSAAIIVTDTTFADVPLILLSIVAVLLNAWVITKSLGQSRKYSMLWLMLGMPVFSYYLVLIMMFFGFVPYHEFEFWLSKLLVLMVCIVFFVFLVVKTCDKVELKKTALQ